MPAAEWPTRSGRTNDNSIPGKYETRVIAMISRTTSVFSLISVLLCHSVMAADRVDIVVGKDAPQLEQVAAQELAKQLPALFHDVTATVTETRPAESKHTILIGSPDTNPLVKHSVDDPWPTGDQTIVIRSRKDGALVVGGGSPAATFWAVHEFGYMNGIRPTLTHDIHPLSRQPLKLSGYDITTKPVLRNRRFQIFSPELIGLQTWEPAAQTRLIHQLAKLKFNGVVIEVAPWQPFVSYELAGVKKQTAMMMAGETFPIDGDTVGKKAFDLAHRQFENTHVSAGLKTPRERTDAGITFLKYLMTTARDFGMEVTLRIARAEAPREFEAVLPGAVSRTRWKELTVAPALELKTWDDAWSDLFRARRDAYLKAYPDIDRMAWTDETKSNSSGHDAVFSFARRFLTNQRPNWQPIDPGPGALVKIPKPGNCRDVVLHLSNANAGVLPQTTLRGLAPQMSQLKEFGWRSFTTSPVGLAEMDSSVLFLARAGWDDDMTPRQAHDALWADTTGNMAASERLWTAWEHLEKATTLISQNAPGFADPGPGMLMKHYVAEPIPEWWAEVSTHYTQYMIELYRSHGAIDGDAKHMLFYSAKRGEFVLEYLAAVKAVREAALARKGGDDDQALEHLGAAVETTYNCINTLSDVARNQSDRAAIAALNKYAFQPLLEALENLESEE